MSDDTQIAKMGQSLPQINQPQQPIQANLNQYGNESTQIAYVQHYDATTNQTVLIMQGTQPAGGTVIGQGVTFNYDCFNFFVLGTEQYDGATFMVPKNRALTESTSDEMKAQCAALTPEAIEIVKTFPALFCSENHYFTKTDPDHMAYFCGRDVCTEEWLHSIVDYDILPMLSEYWFDDANKLQRWENILQGVFQ